MLSGGGESVLQYAQIGFGRKWDDSTAYYFTEYKQNSSTPAVRQILGTATGANTHAYIVSYNTSTGHIDLYFDGTVESSTNFNPIGNWTQPFEPFWSGETHDNGDDMPGTSSNPTKITAMQ
jgi:hypothetical protein